MAGMSHYSRYPSSKPKSRPRPRPRPRPKPAPYCKALQRIPQQIKGRFCMSGSCKTDWSEYTLYWVYGCKANLLDTYHHIGTNHKQLYNYHGFELREEAAWRTLLEAKRLFFDDQRTIFGVLQSIAGVNPYQVVEYLAPLLSNRLNATDGTQKCRNRKALKES